MKSTEPLLKGHKPLLRPPFADMTQFERLLRCVLMAYAKHQLDSPHIGWNQLGDALCAEICNAIGDDAFMDWGDRIKDECGESDVED